MTPQEAIAVDVATRHMVYLLRYSAGELRRVLKLLKDADARLVKLIRDHLEALTRRDEAEILLPTWTTQRLVKLREEIQALQRSTREILNGDLTGGLKDLAEYEGEFQADSLANHFGVTLTVATVAPAQLRTAISSTPFLGRHMKDLVNDLVAAEGARVTAAIRQGYLIGETTPRIIRRIMEEGLDRSYSDVERLVRTGTNAAASMARELVYAENSDLIQSVRWVSTLDGRTTAVCRARDGKVYPLGKGPRPPAHINCRSTTVPVLKTWRELGIDAPEFGPGERPAVRATIPASQIPKSKRDELITTVPADLTYNQWLRTQPESFVREVLGPTRAKLYLDGKLPMDRFVDYSGHEYTLAQLRAREAAAFKRAGL